MLILNIHCKSHEEKANLCYRICESLQGSHAFVANEIVVSDDDNKHPVVTLFVGDKNDRDVMYDMNSDALHETRDWGELV